jgi:ATP-dependent helicase/nuclease subunit A
VFLPDTCGAGSAQSKGGKPVPFSALPRAPDCSKPFVWAIKGAGHLAPVAEAKRGIAVGDAEERDRLLYVAMTRARDRLYVAGFQKTKEREPQCWYNQISDALAGQLQPVVLPDGSTVLRIASQQTASPKADADTEPTLLAADSLPDWAARAAPREPQLTVPLAPSRLAPYETNDEGEPQSTTQRTTELVEPTPTPPFATTVDNKFLRGTLTHALLEHLPAFPKERRRDAATAFVNSRGAALSGRIRSSMISEALAVLNHPDFGDLFGPDSAAEVSIAAEIPRPSGQKGPPLKLTGQIDRLAVTNDHVLIVDYKTNRRPPLAIDGVADIYLYQLSAYGLALQQIYPRLQVRAALLWTETATLMEVPPTLLTRFATKLWQLDPSRLDA